MQCHSQSGKLDVDRWCLKHTSIMNKYTTHNALFFTDNRHVFYLSIYRDRSIDLSTDEETTPPCLLVELRQVVEAIKAQLLRQSRRGTSNSLCRGPFAIVLALHTNVASLLVLISTASGEQRRARRRCTCRRRNATGTHDVVCTERHGWSRDGRRCAWELLVVRVR